MLNVVSVHKILQRTSLARQSLAALFLGRGVTDPQNNLQALTCRSFSQRQNIQGFKSEGGTMSVRGFADVFCFAVISGIGGALPFLIPRCAAQGF